MKKFLLAFLYINFLFLSIALSQQLDRCEVFLLNRHYTDVPYFSAGDDVFLAIDITPLSPLLSGKSLHPVSKEGKKFYSLRELGEVEILSCQWRGEQKRALIALKLSRKNLTWEKKGSQLALKFSFPLPLKFTTGKLPPLPGEGKEQEEKPARVFFDIEGAHLNPPKIEEFIEKDKLRVRLSQYSVAPDVVRMVLDLLSPYEVNLCSPSPSKEINLLISPPSALQGMGILEEVQMERIDDRVRARLKVSRGGSYKTLLLKSPPRLAVDIESAYVSPSFNTPQPLSPIAEVRWSQFSFTPPVVRVVFDLERETRVNIKQDDASYITLEFGSLPPGFPLKLEETLILIDPGHGGQDPGAIGPGGSQEKDANLDIALRLKSLLPNSALTREGDYYVSLQQRVESASQMGAGIFISIHNNALPGGKGSGTETYYYREDSFLLAQYIHTALIRKLGLPDGGVKRRGFYVIKNAPCPAILIEGAYISNPQEEKLLATEEFRQKIAEAIVEGLKAFAKEAK